MKKLPILLISTLYSIQGFAQEAEGKSIMNDPIFPVYVIAGVMFIIIVLLIIVAVALLKTINTITEKAAKEKAAKAGTVYMPAPTWWDRFTQKVNASVPVESEKKIELDHSYDGIKELDNHLPPWWTWLFYATIAWSVVYVIVFHFSNSFPLSLEEYQNEVAVAEEQARQLRASRPEVAIDEQALTFSKDAAIIEKGKSIFTEFNCASCHRNDGGGNTIGPNLTDEYWLHGGDIKNVYSTIKNGAIEKGMPAWGKSMSPEAVRDVTFFVMSLQGTTPPNAKAPQGEIFKAVVEKTDSASVKASL